MFPRTEIERGLSISLCVQTLLQYLLGKETTLWESIHSSTDLNVDVSIFGECGGEIVLLDKIFGEVAEFEAHVCVAGHNGVELEIFDVDSHQIGSRGGDDTFEEDLHCEDIGGGCAISVWVVYLISSDGETRAVGITLLWSVVDHNPNIGDIPTACGGYIGLVDE